MLINCSANLGRLYTLSIFTSLWSDTTGFCPTLGFPIKEMALGSYAMNWYLLFSFSPKWPMTLSMFLCLVLEEGWCGRSMVINVKILEHTQVHSPLSPAHRYGRAKVHTAFYVLRPQAISASQGWSWVRIQVHSTKAASLLLTTVWVQRLHPWPLGWGQGAWDLLGFRFHQPCTDFQGKVPCLLSFSTPTPMNGVFAHTMLPKKGKGVVEAVSWSPH